MKKLIVALGALMMMTMGVFAQDAAPKSKAEITFEKETHDFGKNETAR